MPQSVNLIAKKDFKQLLNSVEKAFKKLHSNGSYKPEDLFKTKEYKDLIGGTSDIISGAVEDNKIPAEMMASLQNDVFHFSAIKTHAQLFEASRLLLTDDGKVKSFAMFSKDIEAIKTGYNQNYLEAEYQFAVTAAQMAGKWAALSPDYLLQYRTASDNRVRDSHAKLHNITLPIDDDFWLYFYPPNGWRCRCNAIQVRKGKYDISDSAFAYAAGEKATTQIGADGKNKLEIFRYNPGKENKVFPPAHPYNKVAGVAVVKKAAEAEIKSKFVPDNLTDYEKKVGVKVNREMFEYLTKTTPLNPAGVRGSGAFYMPGANYVKIPIDDRRKRSKWCAEAIIYHEFGHAADWHNGLKRNPLVTGLMEKYRAIYKKDSNALYKSIDQQLNAKVRDAWKDKDHDALEKILAASDTLMALNPRFGQGHTQAYFKHEGKKEAEFIAHTFENRFAGNDVFKEVMPDLYDEMIELCKKVKPTQE